MGLFDYVKLDNEKFGEDKGLNEQTKDFDCPYMESYVITEAGRLCQVDYETKDLSDPNAKPGSIESFMGCMSMVPTGKLVDLNWHGCLYVGGWKCKFTDGVLVDAVLDSITPAPEKED